eukprot:jgi/Tetstr1/422893/TSEL_013677.t1
MASPASIGQSLASPSFRQQHRRQRSACRGQTWLLIGLCGMCCLATAMFMGAAKRLAAENASLQAQLVAGSLAARQMCAAAGEGREPAGMEAPPDELLASIEACLARPELRAQAPGAAWSPRGEQAEVVLANSEVAARVVVGGALVAVIIGSLLVVNNLDHLPRWLARPLFYALGSGTEALSLGGQQVSLSKLVAYRLDRWFSTNPYSKTLALLYVTLAMIVIGGLGIFTLSKISLDDALWEAIVGVGLDWTFPSDADPEDQDSGLRVVMVRCMGLVVSIGGMLVTALMLGIVSDAIGDKVDQMKKGKAEVLENNHTLILGWSDKLYALIKELANANESIGGSAIVIMSERDKEEMEEDIDAQELDLRGSRVICRTGNPLLSVDLNKVSVHTARAIVVLAQMRDGNSADLADAFSLRIVMSLMSLHQSLPGGLCGHIVCEVCDIDNEPLIEMVASSHHVETVVAHDVIGRLMIQSRRQPGLASVWEGILGFDDNEFYAARWPTLVGKRFSEVLVSFPDAIPVGLVQGTEHPKVLLNPHDDYELTEDDQLLVLAEDDDTYTPADAPQLAPTRPLPKYTEKPTKEKILFLGWRRDMDDMIDVLDDFVCKDSELWLYSEVPLDMRKELLMKGGLDPDDLKNLKLIFMEDCLHGEMTDRYALQAATLLLVRDIQSQHSRAEHGSLSPELLRRAESENLPWYHKLKNCHAVDRCIVISEILDSRTRNLINELNISEYVMSNEIISMALAMVSENASVNQILKELFTEVGNELYVFTANRYLYPGETISFFELIARARERAEIVLGYKGYDMDRPMLNPPDKDKELLNLETTEYIVIMAEEDSTLEDMSEEPLDGSSRIGSRTGSRAGNRTPRERRQARHDNIMHRSPQGSQGDLLEDVAGGFERGADSADGTPSASPARSSFQLSPRSVSNGY